MNVLKETCVGCGGMGYVRRLPLGSTIVCPMCNGRRKITAHYVSYADVIRNMDDEELASLITSTHPAFTRRFVHKDSALAFLKKPYGGNLND